MDYVTVPVELVIRRSTDPVAQGSANSGEDIDWLLETDLAGLYPNLPEP